jgi:hypothetical protein
LRQVKFPRESSPSIRVCAMSEDRRPRLFGLVEVVKVVENCDRQSANVQVD